MRTIDAGAALLRARRLQLESQSEPLVIMHKDCPVCRSEGFRSRGRIELRHGDRKIIATLYQTGGDYVGPGEAGLSEAAWRKLQVNDGDVIEATHSRPLESLSAVRAKIYGRQLLPAQLIDIIEDITAERYSEVELAAFIVAFAGQPFDLNEATALTQAMVAAGERITWGVGPIADKHSVGGLPGNRTTPIVVAIAAAAGLTIPKTSSRAITSPAGTADVMETMTRVDLTLDEMRAVVARCGACLAWGGSVQLSPSDDIIIRVERVLDVDCQAQLAASVLSKKLAAGATHVLLDIPIGPTAKVRSPEAGRELATHLTAIGERLGLVVRPVVCDGSQPIGRGIGPALEARDVLAVLRNAGDAPRDLRSKSIELAGTLLEMMTGLDLASANEKATRLLVDGSALRRFLEICDAQGGFREPPVAALRHVVPAPVNGRVTTIDNRAVARAAKLAGAPEAPAAGLVLHARLGDTVLEGDPMVTLHAETAGELEYALNFVEANPAMIVVSAL